MKMRVLKNGIKPNNLIFQHFLDRGILRIDDIVNSTEEDTMDTILTRVHRFKITRTKDGRYTTYVPDDKKAHGRRQVRRNSLQDLNDYLLRFYDVQEDDKKDMLFGDLYAEWIEHKRSFIGADNPIYSKSPTTIRRYEREFENLIQPMPLTSTMLRDITPPFLMEQLTELIRENDLRWKRAKEVIGYVGMALTYARQKEYILRDLTVTIDREKLMSMTTFVPPKDDEERILTLEEMRRLYAAIRAHEELKPWYMPDYALELAMLTGMRAGELAALNWADIDDHHLHVNHAERRFEYGDRPSERVVGKPKNGKRRKYVLTDEMRELFVRIEKQGITDKDGYIFVNREGVRYTEDALGKAMRNRVQDAGIKKTSIHGIRRTLSSEWNKYLAQRDVAAMLGHSPQVNGQAYWYSTAEEEIKVRAMTEVSSKVINFKGNDDITQKAVNA